MPSVTGLVLGRFRKRKLEFWEHIRERLILDRNPDKDNTAVNAVYPSSLATRSQNSCRTSFFVASVLLGLIRPRWFSKLLPDTNVASTALGENFVQSNRRNLHAVLPHSMRMV